MLSLLLRGDSSAPAELHGQQWGQPDCPLILSALSTCSTTDMTVVHSTSQRLSTTGSPDQRQWWLFLHFTSSSLTQILPLDQNSSDWAKLCPNEYQKAVPPPRVFFCSFSTELQGRNPCRVTSMSKELMKWWHHVRQKKRSAWIGGSDRTWKLHFQSS